MASSGTATLTNDMLKSAKITKTTNGAMAFATSHIGDDIEGSNELKSLVSKLTEMWSSTGMKSETMAEKMKECLILADSLDQADKVNFYALCMAFVLYKRDPRHGKGRRDESRGTLFSVCDKFGANPQLCKMIVKWYFRQGYWGDAKKIIEMFTNPELVKTVLDVFPGNPGLLEQIKTLTCELIVEQLNADLQLVAKIEQLKKSADPNSNYEEIKKLCEQLSGCAKWLPTPRSNKKRSNKVKLGKKSEDVKGSKDSKGTKKRHTKSVVKPQSKLPKDRTRMSLIIAQQMFPTIQPNTFYYGLTNGVIDKTKKIDVVEKTPLYYKWLNLFSAYHNTLKTIRAHIPFVEKFTQKGSYHSINPSMLTTVNKLRLDNAMKNKLPRYIQSNSNLHIPRGRLNELKAKYGKEKRFEHDKDRDDCKQRVEEYEKAIIAKAIEKKAKQAELEKRKQELLSQGGSASASAAAGTAAEIEEIEKEMAELAAEKLLNFNAGTPVDVYKAYVGNNRQLGDDAVENLMYEACIMELMTGKLAELAQIPILCIADTSGSMYSMCTMTGDDVKTDITPIQMCIAMTAFFAKSAPEGWKHRFIQFSEQAFVVNLAQQLNKEDPSFFDYIKYMQNHPVNAGSTNFESVLNQLRILFAKADGVVLPKYVLWHSDMQYNQATGAHNLYARYIHHKAVAQGGAKGGAEEEEEEAEPSNVSNTPPGELLRKLFIEELGYTKEQVPIIVFWNLNCHDNRPALATDENIIMLAGPNPKLLIDINSVVENAVPQSVFDQVLEEQKEKSNQQNRINTWNTFVQVLASSEATVPFLEDVQLLIGHTLCDNDETGVTGSSSGKVADQHVIFIDSDNDSCDTNDNDNSDDSDGNADNANSEPSLPLSSPPPSSSTSNA